MDLLDAIFDPEMGCTSFDVDRITYIRSRQGVSSRTDTFHAAGCVHPGTPEMIQLLPEENKTDEFIAIYTDFALSTGTPEQSGGSAFFASDQIRWDDRTWRVVRVKKWSLFGYFKALAVLLHEEGGT